ncbi:UNVERIFIED_CONTAM: hypothetical protein Sradi_6647200 [Sesamum radiatum]|uniref:Retrotransposon gag domain-containing protein n=1 Tax=Sesamum radiatum TaxID=300843 RepID=A0AAW2JMQ9_SESRA
MVTSWLLNSISKDIVESFLYASTTRELWEEVEARFGESNGPHIYQIRREIASVVQGNLSISAYFSKIKRFVTNLMMEPLPSISKAYSMILRVEKQREVSAGLSTAIQNMAMQVRGGDTKKTGNFRNFQKRKGILDKKDTYFDIHGVPEWYRTLMEQRRKTGASTSKAFNTLENQEATEELA